MILCYLLLALPPRQAPAQTSQPGQPPAQPPQTAEPTPVSAAQPAQTKTSIAAQAASPSATQTAGQTERTTQPTQAVVPRIATQPTQASAQTAAPASQTTQPTRENSQPIDSAFHLLDSIFNRPKFEFETLEPDIPGDMAPIILRFNNAIATNQQWFNEYRNKYSGVPLPYNPRFGITATEYGRILHLQSVPPPLAPVDSQQVTVLKDAGVISFVCSNNEDRLLNYLSVDAAHRTLVYGSDTIPFIGPARTAANSPYGQWQGFSWHLEKTETQSVGDTTLVTARVVEVNIGVPSDGGKTFIRITYQSIQGDTPTANTELLGYIR